MLRFWFASVVLATAHFVAASSMRLLFISLEFKSETFSGNGVYAQSQVRAISNLGHEVLVISARPIFSKEDTANKFGGVHVIEVPVSTWHRHDAKSPWKEFADGINGDVISKIQNFQCDVVIGADWSSLPVYQKVKQGLKASNPAVPRFVYSSYRIYSRTAEEEDLDFIKRMETDCLEQSAASLVLCSSDKEFVLEHLKTDKTASDPYVLLPPLRNDLEAIPPPQDLLQFIDGQCGLKETRTYFTCCVRLSPEKEPHRFVDIAVEMSRRGLFETFNMTPFMCGSSSSDYAQDLKRRLAEAVPNSVIEERFMNSTTLAELFSRTRLNIHPCTYDAYGMTIVEAASQGAPSIVHCGGAVGACDFLRSGQNEIIEVDMGKSVEDIVDRIEAVLSDDMQLKFVGLNAAARARAYTEEVNAVELLEVVEQTIM